MSKESVKRFKDKVRTITRRSRGVKLDQVITELKYLLTGWRAYYGFSEIWKSLFGELDSWIRRRLRCFILKQWKRGTTIYAELRKRKVSQYPAAIAANGSYGYWHRSGARGMNIAFPTKFFDEAGLPRLCRVS